MPDVILHDFFAVPEVTDLTINGATCHWSWPKKLSMDVYDASYWSGINLADFVASTVNDGELGSTAWRWTVGGASYLVYDAGVGNTKAFREVWYTYDSAVSGDAPSFWYADDPAGLWTQIVISPFLTKTIEHAGSTMVTAVRIFPASVGDNRCWRAGDANVASAGAFSEMWFREYVDDYEDIEAFLVYDATADANALHTYIAAAKIPSVDAPMNLVPLVRTTVSFVQTDEVLSFAVRVLTREHGESVGLKYQQFSSSSAGLVRSEYVRQNEQLWGLLENGLNSDLTLPAGPCDAVVQGPTAAFSIGGIGTGEDLGGEYATIWNWTGQNMTIVHEDAASTAAMRIKMLSGANVTIVGNGFAVLRRSAAQNRWIFMFGRDSTGLK